MHKVISILSLLVPLSIFAQNDFLPVIDSSLICSFNEGRMRHSIPDSYGYSYEELEIFYIVEEMPKPRISIGELETALKKNIKLNAKEKSLEGIVYLQCIVNCKGEAGDFQILNCPAEFVNISCKLSVFFQENVVNWNPPIQRGSEVDILIQIKVNIKRGRFKVVAPFY